MPVNIKSIADFWARIKGDSAEAGNGTSSSAPARFDHYNSDFATGTALSDTDANPTTTSVGAKGQIFDGTNWTRVRQAVSGSITSLIGIMPAQVIGQYLSTLPTLANNEWRSLLLTARGELITAVADYVSSPVTITAADSGSATTTGQNNQSIISGTATAGSTVAITVSGDSSFAVKVGGAWVGTLQFERTLD